ncbi:MAG: membrane dipeptidase [Solobacterium sp.]|nr:membrane dipeptidase [Solobacterium sp.]MBR2668744.1 membrane dipeptidase [Solobacterium sp.]
MSHTIDMHCDTLMLALFKDGPEADVYDRPDQHLDVKRLVEGGAMAQFFAIFIPPKGVYAHFNRPAIPEAEYIEGCVKIFHNTLERHSDVLAEAKNADDIERNFKDGKVSAVLTMEDGVEVHGMMSNLDKFYDMGIRALTLTWNFENCFGAPNNKDPFIMNKGLTSFGRDAVKHMQDIGMLVDVSHVSDGVFWDVFEIAKVPFVATHSNCRALCGHTRNMTDDMIKALYKKGGAMGINFGHEFLDATEGSLDSRINDMVAMALHEKEIAGTEVIAIGTDFDGIGGNLEVNGPDKMHLLFDALVKAGFTTAEVDQIAYGNVLRIMHEAVK